MPLNAVKEARRILDVHWWAIEGNGALPVDPVRIARRLGLSVRKAELQADLSGAIFRNKGEDPVILLNAADSPNRQRFTCGHEIGHYVKRVEEEPEGEIEFVDRRDMLSAVGSDDGEKFANAFAAELLIPAGLLGDVIEEEDPPMWRLAAIFGVSTDAMGFRRKNLGI